MSAHHWNAALGAGLGAFGLVALIWWIPSDVETGVLEETRYAVQIGDAMMPTVVMLAIVVLSGLLVGQAWLQRGAEPEAGAGRVGLSRDNLRNLAVITAILSTGVALMVWTGPLLVEALGGMGVTEKTYRELSATVPYKYSGFALGGFVMVFGLIAWVQGRATARAALTAAGIVLLLIALYDLPFDSLLLPPNGSV